MGNGTERKDRGGNNKSVTTKKQIRRDKQRKNKDRNKK